jgi:hypothetical protein
MTSTIAFLFPRDTRNPSLPMNVISSGAEPVHLPLRVARALRPKRLRQIRSSRVLRRVKRRSPIRVRDVRIGAAAQEEIDGVATPLGDRVMERRFAAVIDGVYVHIAREEPPGETGEIADHGIMEKRPPPLVRRIDRCAALKERIDDPLAARGCGEMEVAHERSGIPFDRAAGVEKQPDRLDASFAKGARKRRLAAVVPRIELGAARGKQFHDLRATARGREMERRFPLRAPFVEGCAFRNEKFHDARLALARGEMNRDITPRVSILEQRPVRDERVDDCGVSVVRRVEKRRLAEGVPGIRVGPPFEKKQHGVHSSHHRGAVKGRVLPFIPGIRELRRSIDELF